MTFPLHPPKEETVEHRAIRIYERAPGRLWDLATDTERDLARSAARSDLWAESLEARIWRQAEAEQCFKGD